MNNPFKAALALITMSLAGPAIATPAAHDQLRVHNGLPTKSGDILFSFSAEWRIDDGELFRTSGMSFLNADKLDANTPPTAITKKLVGALKEGLMQLDPGLRGITVQQDADKPELTIANRAGYAVTSIVVRDYTNQPLRFDLINKTFAEDKVQVALDLVLAADVEYLDGFSSRQSQTASEGEIEVQVDEQTPVIIKTDGKSTRELEQELVRHLTGAKISDSTLVPHVIHTDTRNTKPFDGSEVQLSNLNAKRIAVQIRSKSLGILNKFKYKNDTVSAGVLQPSQIKTLLPALIALGLGFFWYSSRKKA